MSMFLAVVPHFLIRVAGTDDVSAGHDGYSKATLSQRE
jgi:hypothetical protein